MFNVVFTFTLCNKSTQRAHASSIVLINSVGTYFQFSWLIIGPFFRPMIDPQLIILFHFWSLFKKHFQDKV